MVVTSPFLAGNKAKASLAVIMVFLLTLMVLLFGAVVADAQDPDPDPDPVYYYPDASSNVGDIVLNPATDQQTVVVELILDPVEAGPNPQVSFVVIDAVLRSLSMEETSGTVPYTWDVSDSMDSTCYMTINLRRQFC